MARPTAPSAEFFAAAFEVGLGVKLGTGTVFPGVRPFGDKLGVLSVTTTVVPVGWLRLGELVITGVLTEEEEDEDEELLGVADTDSFEEDEDGDEETVVAVLVVMTLVLGGLLMLDSEAVDEDEDGGELELASELVWVAEIEVVEPGPVERGEDVVPELTVMPDDTIHNSRQLQVIKIEVEYDTPEELELAAEVERVLEFTAELCSWRATRT